MGIPIWAMVRAGKTARDYNDGLRFYASVTKEGASLGLTFSFKRALQKTGRVGWRAERLQVSTPVILY